MRKQYEKVLKTFFREKIFLRRDELEITQEEMADRLMMACRTYVDIEHGKSGCGVLTLAIYLVYICADPIDFLNELRNVFEDIIKEAA